MNPIYYYRYSGGPQNGIPNFGNFLRHVMVKTRRAYVAGTYHDLERGLNNERRECPMMLLIPGRLWSDMKIF